MLRIAKSREVLWPVTVKAPVDGGKVESYDVKIRYRLPTRTESRELAEAEEPRKTELLCDRIVGWEGFGDEEGEALPFNRETLRAVLEIPYVASAIFVGLLQAAAGAERKN